jgi:hypothetical protein
MKKLFAASLIALVAAALNINVAAAQNCQHDSDRAADCSRCGSRSSDSRPGGR